MSLSVFCFLFHCACHVCRVYVTCLSCVCVACVSRVCAALPARRWVVRCSVFIARSSLHLHRCRWFDRGGRGQCPDKAARGEYQLPTGAAILPADSLDHRPSYIPSAVRNPPPPQFDRHLLCHSFRTVLTLLTGGCAGRWLHPRLCVCVHRLLSFALAPYPVRFGGLSQISCVRAEEFVCCSGCAVFSSRRLAAPASSRGGSRRRLSLVVVLVAPTWS